MGLALLLVDPGMTIFLGAYFLIVGISVHRLVAPRAAEANRTNTNAFINGQQALEEALNAHREIATSGRQTIFISRVSAQTSVMRKGTRQMLFLNQLPKNAYEGALEIGAVAAVAWQAYSRDLASAAALLVVFLAAASRVVPSLSRLNAQLIAARGSAGAAAPMFRLLGTLAEDGSLARQPKLTCRAGKNQRYSNSSFVPHDTATELSFRYP